jgi:hypothetical protein
MTGRVVTHFDGAGIIEFRRTRLIALATRGSGIVWFKFLETR